jgi:hypothetical protein
MKRILPTLIALMTLALVACGGAEQEETPSTLDGLDSKQILKQTDYSVCDEGTPATSAVGHWSFKYRKDAVTSEMTISIFEDKMRIIQVCTDNRGQNIEAQAKSKIEIDETTIKATDYSVDEKKFDSKNSKSNQDTSIGCKASITPGPMTYKFKGQCLILSQNSSGKDSAIDITFVPVH